MASRTPFRKRLLNDGRLARLKEKIENRARAEWGKQNRFLQLESKRAELVQLRGKLALVPRNLALAKSDEEFRSNSDVFSELKSEEKKMEKELALLDRQARPVAEKAEVEKALALIPSRNELAADASNSAALGSSLA